MKLLLVILPLVCLPVGAVAYLSVSASLERVNDLTRQEQITKVEQAASKINNVFYQTRLDLEAIARLPALKDYTMARTMGVESYIELNKQSVAGVLWDFIAMNPFYLGIEVIDGLGNRNIRSGRYGVDVAIGFSREKEFLAKVSEMGPRGLYVSGVRRAESFGGHILYLAKPLYDEQNAFAGAVVIILNFERIKEIVGRVAVGEKGYAFLMDQLGRAIVHPSHQPYGYTLGDMLATGMKEMAQDMTFGNTGWKGFVMDGLERGGAYSPVRSMSWSLASVVANEEFFKQAGEIQSRAIQVVALTLIITIFMVSVLFYTLLKPIRRLVAATDRIAAGDLSIKVPIRSHDELGRLTESFNKMTGSLAKANEDLVRSEKLASLGRLAAGIAHEIRNPLFAMKSAMVYLQRRFKDEPLIGEYGSVVLEEIDRLNRFVSDFLHLGKQSQPRPVATDLNRMVGDTIAVFEHQAREKGYRFHSSPAAGLPWVMIDPYQFEQVLVNLVVNAMDAQPGGGDIYFSTHLLTGGASPLGGSAVRLSVRDQGAGIPEEHMAKIYDPFFTTKDDGTGLGLPITLGIVESHGGRLSIASTPGQGTTVNIDIALTDHGAGGEAGNG